MKKRSANIRAKLLPVGAFCLILLIWWGLSASGMIPGYMLPSPADVVGAFIHDFPNLMHHAFVSVTEALLGLLIGMALAATVYPPAMMYSVLLAMLWILFPVDRFYHPKKQ